MAGHRIQKVEVFKYEDLGMEAVWTIKVEAFPTFTVINHEGKDFYTDLVTQCSSTLVQVGVQGKK